MESWDSRLVTLHCSLFRHIQGYKITNTRIHIRRRPWLKKPSIRSIKIYSLLITHADGSCVGLDVQRHLCLSLSVFSTLYLKNQRPTHLRSPNLTKKCSTMRPEKSVYFWITWSKVKVTCYKNLCRSRRNAKLPLAAYVSLAGFAQLQYLTAQAGKRIAGVGHGAVVSAGFFLVEYCE